MKNPYFFLIKTAWRYAKKEKKKFLLIYLMCILSDITVVLNPILWGWFINEIQKDPFQIPHLVLIYGSAFIVLRLVEWALQGPASVKGEEMAFNLSCNYLEDIYHQVLQLPLKWHKDHHSASTIMTISKAYSSIKSFSSGGYVYLRSLTRLTSSMVAMIYFSAVYGAIGFLAGILTIVVAVKYDKPYVELLKKTNELDKVVSSTFFDSLSNITTVITLRLQKSMENGLLSRVRETWPIMRKIITLNEWKWFTIYLMIGFIYVFTLIGYVYQNYHPHKVFLIGSLVTLAAFVNQFTNVFYEVAAQWTQLLSQSINVKMASEISEEYQKILPIGNENSYRNTWKKVTISNVSFTYNETYNENDTSKSLHNLTFSFERGKKIAFIGESGGGKSTILSIIRGLYNAEPGLRVNADGTDIAINELFPYVTLIPQEPEIFEDTILFNVTLGLPFDNKTINDVCDASMISEVIQQLPKGIQSLINEKGVNLSGGQKQRLALARGILAATNSEIILLDEPTSSVDSKTESIIYSTLFKKFNDRVVISVMHRLHFLDKFDYIYIIQGGRIVDEGSFDRLRKESRVFHDLWKPQEQNNG